MVKFPNTNAHSLTTEPRARGACMVMHAEWTSCPVVQLDRQPCSRNHFNTAGCPPTARMYKSMRPTCTLYHMRASLSTSLNKQFIRYRRSRRSHHHHRRRRRRSRSCRVWSWGSRFPATTSIWVTSHKIIDVITPKHPTSPSPTGSRAPAPRVRRLQAFGLAPVSRERVMRPMVAAAAPMPESRGGSGNDIHRRPHPTGSRSHAPTAAAPGARA